MRFVDRRLKILLREVLLVLLDLLVDALVMRLECLDLFVCQLLTHDSENKSRAQGRKL